MTDNAKKRREEEDRRKMAESDYLTIGLTARKTGLSQFHIRDLVKKGIFTDVYMEGNKYMIHIPTFLDFMQKNHKGA